MNVAVTMFKGGVSPRLDISDSIWVYHIETDKKTVTLLEKCSFSFAQPAQLVMFLKEKRITAVVCGGCPHFFLRMLVSHGVKVVPGIIGDLDQVLNRLAQGNLAYYSPADFNGLPGRYCRRHCRGIDIDKKK